MATTERALRGISDHIDESMGVRRTERAPQLSPVASARDTGRRPLRKFGRLNVERIAADPTQPRTEFGVDEIEKLAGSIRRNGQLHPIRVRWNDEMQKWIIVTGERRYRATLAAGLTEIECYFDDNELGAERILEQQLVENLIRRDLRPLEEARGYQALMELNGWTGKQVAESLQVSTSRVSRALALLDLPESVQNQIEAGEIPKTTAYELSKLDNEEVQDDLAGQTANAGLTQRKLSKAVRKRKGKAASASSGVRQTYATENGIDVVIQTDRKCNYHEIEESLRQALEEVRLRIDNNVQLY